MWRREPTLRWVMLKWRERAVKHILCHEWARPSWLILRQQSCVDRGHEDFDSGPRRPFYPSEFWLMYPVIKTSKREDLKTIGNVIIWDPGDGSWHSWVMRTCLRWTDAAFIFMRGFGADEMWVRAEPWRLDSRHHGNKQIYMLARVCPSPRAFL